MAKWLNSHQVRKTTQTNTSCHFFKKILPDAGPDGEKGTIKKLCGIDYPVLFDGDTSFDNAWKNGRNLFKMANHASFAKRGKQ